MRSSRHMSVLLAAAAVGLLASTGGPLAPLPVPEPARSGPPKPAPYPREPRSPIDTLSRRQRKRERIKEKQRLKGGIAGAKLWKKANRGRA